MVGQNFLQQAAGTIASGHRMPSYRALSMAHTHVLVFDYIGFGNSRGIPDEKELLLYAISVVDWALHTARIPSSRIVIFSQSIGTSINIAVGEYCARLDASTVFGGHMLDARFEDVPTLLSTCAIGGILPLFRPLPKAVSNRLRLFLADAWRTKDHLASYVQINELRGNRYCLTLIHSKNDTDILW